MKKFIDTLFKLNLQFFAEGGSEGGSDGSGGGEGGNPEGGSGNEGNEGKGNGDGKGGKSGGATVSMTQAELNRLLAAEKKEGRLSILKAMGVTVDDAKTNKEVMEKFKNWQQSQKTELELAQEQLKAMEQTQSENESLKIQLKALSMGAKPETVGDLISLAFTKVDENNSIESVLENLKASYPVFFAAKEDGESGGNNGTGRARGGQGNGGDGKKETLADRIAKRQKSSPERKNPYFRE